MLPAVWCRARRGRRRSDSFPIVVPTISRTGTREKGTRRAVHSHQHASNQYGPPLVDVTSFRPSPLDWCVCGSFLPSSRPARLTRTRTSRTNERTPTACIGSPAQEEKATHSISTPPPHSIAMSESGPAAAAAAAPVDKPCSCSPNPPLPAEFSAPLDNDSAAAAAHSDAHSTSASAVAAAASAVASSAPAEPAAFDWARHVRFFSMHLHSIPHGYESLVSPREQCHTPSLQVPAAGHRVCAHGLFGRAVGGLLLASVRTRVASRCFTSVSRRSTCWARSTPRQTDRHTTADANQQHRRSHVVT